MMNQYLSSSAQDLRHNKLQISLQRNIQLIQQYPYQIPAYINCSTIFMLINKHEQACQILNKALEYNKYDYRIYYSLFAVHHRNQDWNNARNNMRCCLSMLYVQYARYLLQQLINISPQSSLQKQNKQQQFTNILRDKAHRHCPTNMLIYIIQFIYRIKTTTSDHRNEPQNIISALQPINQAINVYKQHNLHGQYGRLYRIRGTYLYKINKKQQAKRDIQSANNQQCNIQTNNSILDVNNKQQQLQKQPLQSVQQQQLKQQQLKQQQQSQAQILQLLNQYNYITQKYSQYSNKQLKHRCYSDKKDVVYMDNIVLKTIDVDKIIKQYIQIIDGKQILGGSSGLLESNNLIKLNQTKKQSNQDTDIYKQVQAHQGHHQAHLANKEHHLIHQQAHKVSHQVDHSVHQGAHQQAHQQGILQANHRIQQLMNISSDKIQLYSSNESLYAKVQITIIIAQFTENTELTGKINPYIILNYNKKQKYTSKIISDGGEEARPKLQNETVVFNLEEKTSILKVDIWDHDSLKWDNHIGKGQVLIRETGLYSVLIKTTEDQEVGTVYLFVSGVN